MPNDAVGMYECSDCRVERRAECDELSFTYTDRIKCPIKSLTSRLAKLKAERTASRKECTRLRAILTTALDTGLTSKNFDAHECWETTKAARAALAAKE